MISGPAKQQINDERGTGRVSEHRNSRRVAAQGHKKSGEEDRRGDPSAPLLDERRARRGRRYEEDRPGGIPPGHCARSSSPGQERSSSTCRSCAARLLQTAVIERYRRRETSVEAIVEMYLAGVSTQEESRRLRTSSERRPCPPAPSQPQREGVRVHRGLAPEAARGRLPLRFFVDGIYLKRSWGPYENGRSGGHRRQLHRRPGGHRLRGGYTESADSWREILLVAQGAQALRRAARHRRQVRGDARCARGVFPGSTLPALHGPLLPKRWERVPVTRRKAVARMLKAIHAQESREACSRKAAEVATGWTG